MKTVQAFVTADDRVFKDKEEAQDHELFLTIRGVIQTGNTKGQTPPQAICGDWERVYEILKKHKRAVSARKG